MTNALERVGRKANSGTLNVSLVTTFALGWLVPRLHRFQSKHPEIEVRISATDRLDPVGEGDVDIGIRYGRGQWPGVEAELLLQALQQRPRPTARAPRTDLGALLRAAQALMPRYANAQTISFTDPRIKATYVTYPSPGGTSASSSARPYVP